MQYQVTTQTVAAQPLAVIEGRAHAANIATVIRELLDQVWQFLRAKPDSEASAEGMGTGAAPATTAMPDGRPGRNVVIYHGEDPDFNFFGEQPGRVEMGVEVASAIAGKGNIVPGTTPAGLVATTTHWGDYAGLPAAHAAIIAWCREHGYPTAVTHWEVYGHWSDDPKEVRTDVYYLLS